jgi:hypothetical protein
MSAPGRDAQGRNGLDGSPILSGGCELSVSGTLLWSMEEQPDPNPHPLRRDSAPVESDGILIYPVAS